MRIKQSDDNKIEMTQMLKLSNQNFKAAIKKMFQKYKISANRKVIMSTN